MLLQSIARLIYLGFIYVSHPIHLQEHPIPIFVLLLAVVLTSAGHDCSAFQSN